MGDVKRYDPARYVEMREAPGGPYVLHSDYTILLARHNVLVEAIHTAMGRTADCDKKHSDEQLIADVAYLKRLASDYFNTSIDCGNRAFAAEQKYDTLVEAVKKIKKYARHYPDCNESESPFCQCGLEAARAEVDRLIAAADCKGEE